MKGDLVRQSVAATLLTVGLAGKPSWWSQIKLYSWRKCWSVSSLGYKSPNATTQPTNWVYLEMLWNFVFI